MLKYKDKLRKLASLGGGQDGPFEQAFSSLAHAYLQDKAPSLMDYEVGFQLVDRNQENTKAVGVFGFKVGSQWLLAPVFFLNGTLKGHELLYIKNQDIFVPMKENWLNYLLNRKPHVLGSGVDKNLNNLGVMAPNFYQISRSPAKYASAQKMLKKFAAWARPFIVDLAEIASSSPLHDQKYTGIKSFLDLVKEAGDVGVKFLVNTVTKYPALLNHLNSFYGQSTVDATVKQAALNSKIKKSNIRPKLTKSASIRDVLTRPHKKADMQIRIISYKRLLEAPQVSTSLSENEKAKIQKGEIVIKDDRDDKDITLAYNLDTTQTLQSPDETGLYEVLTKPGTFRKCLVLFGPYDTHGRKPQVLVVDVENKAWNLLPSTEIYTTTKYDRSRFEKWYKELSDSSLTEGYSLKMLISPTGEGTLPFRVYRETGGDPETYEIYFSNHPRQVRPFGLPQRTWSEYEALEETNKKTDRIVLTDHEGTSFKSIVSELLVPSEFKVISLDQSECGCGDDSDPPAVLHMGTLADLHMGIMKASCVDKLHIRSSGTFTHFNDGPALNKNDALVYLVKDTGLREKQARDVLYDVAQNKKQTILLKRAAPDYDLQKSSPSAPPMPEQMRGMDPMGGDVPTTYPEEYKLPITDIQAQNYDRSVYDPRPGAYSQPNMVGGIDDNTAQVAMEAAQSGQKEVFDTTMLGSLLKAVRDDTMVDKYIGDLMKGMDRLGRILFLFYWHKDEFEDRYGKQDLPELEDGLRNAFEANGDIILFLKQKSIEPYPDEISDVDLTSIGGS